MKELGTLVVTEQTWDPEKNKEVGEGFKEVEAGLTFSLHSTQLCLGTLTQTQRMRLQTTPFAKEPRLPGRSGFVLWVTPSP